MARSLDEGTLQGRAEYYAARFLGADRPHPLDAGRFVDGPSFVLADLFGLTFKDEFEPVVAELRELLGGKARARFDELAAAELVPREDAVLEALLREKLAIDLDGNHIEGAIGTTVVGSRLVGRRVTRHGVKSAWWPIYAGEEAERGRGDVALKDSGGPLDRAPPPDAIWPGETEHLGYGLALATNPRISAAGAIAMCNALVDLLDEGTGAGVIQGRTGAQPADPDASATGTLLFTLVFSATAFGAAVDAAPGGQATAASITADTSADATGTLGYNRCSSSNNGAAPLNDHLDGEAGTSGADFNYNTLSIVAGAQVEMTSMTVTQPQS